MNYNLWMYPKFMNNFFIPNDYNIPPTIYSLLNSYLNFENPNPISINNLAKNGRQMFFDFDYPIAFNREEFECMILNHFMMRRIGYETVTAFKLALNVKLNEIMPMYNKLFSAINGWEIFKDGESVTRTQSTLNISTNNINNLTTSTNTSDRRFSDTPQNALEDIQNGEYVSQYNYDTNSDNVNSNTNGSSNDSGNLIENITRTSSDKMNNYIQFIKEKQNIYTMIFKDLDVLFYQLT